MRTLLLLSILLFSYASPAYAQTECLIGEIRIFAGNFAPRGWALCNGQTVQVNDNPALFSILGTTYGGDGRTNFALPDLRGRAAIHSGTGPGLSERRLGQHGGQEEVALSISQMPTHNHSVIASSADADTKDPLGGSFAAGKGKNAKLYNGNAPDVELSPDTSGTAGGSQAHNNMPPYLGVNYIICLEGIYPSRN